uniref:THAP-type domain-containing protein n=1 Tax=Magallana gigas TaxID=29159 RepID=A0A8W8KAL4_MAGGI
MPQYCCVPGCTGYGGHKFPHDKIYSKKWRIAIKRTDPKTKQLWKPGPNDVVCKAHFVSSDYKSTLLGERARLKEDAVPSVFPFTSTTSKRRQLVTRIPSQPSICDYQGVQHEIIVESSNDETENLEIELTPDELVSNESVQCTLLGRFSIENIRTDPKAINYYTASDRQIIECSNIIKPESNMFLPKDSIMADRGIMVQDLFAPMDVYVNTPTMLKGKSQLEPKDVVRDRRIASKRIHVERVIGLSKTYKILSHPLPSSKCVLGSRIVFVCFSLSNFRKPIVDGYA